MSRCRKCPHHLKFLKSQILSVTTVNLIPNKLGVAQQTLTLTAIGDIVSEKTADKSLGSSALSALKNNGYNRYKCYKVLLTNSTRQQNPILGTGNPLLAIHLT